MALARDDQMLVDALRNYAEGRKGGVFPFDDLRFTCGTAAAAIKRLATGVTEPLAPTRNAVGAEFHGLDFEDRSGECAA